MTCEEFKQGLFKLKRSPETDDLLLRLGKHTESCKTCCEIFAEHWFDEINKAPVPESSPSNDPLKCSTCEGCSYWVHGKIICPTCRLIAKGQTKECPKCSVEMVDCHLCKGVFHFCDKCDWKPEHYKDAVDNLVEFMSLHFADEDGIATKDLVVVNGIGKMSDNSVVTVTNLSVEGLWVAIEDLKNNTFQIKKCDPGTVLLREGEKFSAGYIFATSEQELLETISKAFPDMKRINVVGDPL